MRDKLCKQPGALLLLSGLGLELVGSVLRLELVVERTVLQCEIVGLWVAQLANLTVQRWA